MAETLGAQAKLNTWGNSNFNTYLGYGGLGIAGIGLLGSLFSGSDNSGGTKTLDQAIGMNRDRINKLQGMYNETENQEFNQFTPEAQFAMSALSKLAAENEKKMQNQMARTGMAETGAGARITANLGLEREAQMGSTINQIQSQWQTRKDNKMLALEQLIGGAESSLYNLLGQKEQIEETRKLREAQENAQFWGTLGQIGGTLATLL